MAIKTHNTDQDSWVTVYESYDPVEAELVHELLHREGYATLRAGIANPALLGVGQCIARQGVRVSALEVV